MVIHEQYDITFQDYGSLNIILKGNVILFMYYHAGQDLYISPCRALRCSLSFRFNNDELAAPMNVVKVAVNIEVITELKNMKI